MVIYETDMILVRYSKIGTKKERWSIIEPEESNIVEKRKVPAPGLEPGIFRYQLSVYHSMLNAYSQNSDFIYSQTF